MARTYAGAAAQIEPHERAESGGRWDGLTPYTVLCADLLAGRMSR
jgi:hypothetical protein